MTIFSQKKLFNSILMILQIQMRTERHFQCLISFFSTIFSTRKYNILRIIISKLLSQISNFQYFNVHTDLQKLNKTTNINSFDSMKGIKFV